jgi:hypothetical protein
MRRPFGLFPRCSLGKNSGKTGCAIRDLDEAPELQLPAFRVNSSFTMRSFPNYRVPHGCY